MNLAAAKYSIGSGLIGLAVAGIQFGKFIKLGVAEVKTEIVKLGKNWSTLVRVDQNGSKLKTS